MHEMSIATEIYRLSREAMEEGGGVRLESVAVAVGDRTGVEPELLSFAWEALTTGTGDAGATLEVEWHPARQLCENCGEVAERAPGSWLRLCPRCEGVLRLEGGDQLDLLRVSFTAKDNSEAVPP
jgi:hydrogenase nickel incorporation protein HypA/HybF